MEAVYCLSVLSVILKIVAAAFLFYFFDEALVVACFLNYKTKIFQK